jgi:hypothetical protein
MKPSVIYSYIVDVLRNCRSGGTSLRGDNAARNLNAHTFECILAECKAAVAERRDIADFRNVCERTLEKVLRMKLHISEADANGINPLFRRKMVSCSLMLKSDQCHPAEGLIPVLDLTNCYEHTGEQSKSKSKWEWDASVHKH